MDTPLDVCRQRDYKNVYKEEGDNDFSYEPPTQADLVVETEGKKVKECTEDIVRLLQARNLLNFEGAVRSHR